MTRHHDCPTIASEEAYSDWSKAVDEELTKRHLDLAEAHDFYSFHDAYYDFGMNPVQTADDYEVWMRDNG